MKKYLIFMILFSVGILNVNASTVYYTNDNNVNFTERQYDFFTEMYFDGYQEYMTQEDFDYFELEMMNPDLVESEYISDIITRATSVNDGTKTLKISKSSTNEISNVSIVTTWNTNPNVKSYDVIGARLSSVSLKDTPTTKLINSKGTSNYSVSVSSNNGFGTSVPLSGNNMKVTQTFKVSNGGTVYASYQHAKTAISLANSKRYTISANGYGGVFAFTGLAISTYDKMNGVSISV